MNPNIEKIEVPGSQQADLADTFRAVFSAEATHRSSAHGRVNLMGEHTDYNGGLVLPMPIPQSTEVLLRPREDDVVWCYSVNASEGVRAEVYRLGQEVKTGEWIDYIQGVTAMLASFGHRTPGFDLLVSSNVPMGSGLSSSAALEVSVLRVLRDAFDIEIDDVAIARLGQKVENVFVGAPVGIMDQMAASLGDPEHCLFLDTRAMTFERVRWPKEAMSLFVFHSGISHSNIGGGYADRKRECEEAARALGVNQLSDLGVADLSRLTELSITLEKRARHVITENARVVESVEALRSSNAVKLGQLFDASHESQSQFYEVSTPEIDTLVAIAKFEPEVYGARLTGGGFGGSICVVARPGADRTLSDRIMARYLAETGHQAHCLLPR